MRIRHPKKEKKSRQQKPEEKKHFVLDVHNSSVSNAIGFGTPKIQK